MNSTMNQRRRRLSALLIGLLASGATGMALTAPVLAQTDSSTTTTVLPTDQVTTSTTAGPGTTTTTAPPEQQAPPPDGQPTDNDEGAPAEVPTDQVSVPPADPAT